MFVNSKVAHKTGEFNFLRSHSDFRQNFLIPKAFHSFLKSHLQNLIFLDRNHEFHFASLKIFHLPCSILERLISRWWRSWRSCRFIHETWNELPGTLFLVQNVLITEIELLFATFIAPSLPRCIAHATPMFAQRRHFTNHRRSPGLLAQLVNWRFYVTREATSRRDYLVIFFSSSVQSFAPYRFTMSLTCNIAARYGPRV